MADFSTRRPMWLTVVAVLLVLWGAIGCYTCIQQFRLGADAMPGATDYDRDLLASLPAWYNYVYGVAVGAGLLGALALLVGSRAARALFVVSLAAVVIQFGYLFATTDIVAVKGAGTMAFPVFIAAVAVLQIWLAGFAQRKGWLA